MLTKRKDNANEINFTLRVSAISSPQADPKNYKLKVSMDLDPEIYTSFENYTPNFDAKQVREILDFISEDVIRKVIEHIYFDRESKFRESPLALKDPGVQRALKETLEIYDARRKSKSKDYPGEEKIIAIVDNFINQRNPKLITEEERNVTQVRYERFSASKTYYSVQERVNGDKRPL